MLRGGAAKPALPRTGAQERTRLASNPTSSTSTGMRTSRSSSTIAADLRLSKLKRASSDDALAKPGLGSAATATRLKKTVTTGAISELADNRPRSLTGVQSAKKTGIPAPREISSTSRERVSLRDQLRTSSSKKMIPSSSTSSLSALSKHPRGTTKPRAETDAADRALLECQVKELLAEAKAKEFEISKLRLELQRCRGKGTPPEAGTPPGAPGDGERPPLSPDAQILVGELREKNGRFQRELAALREENQALKEKLIAMETSPVSGGDCPATTASPTSPTANGLPLTSDGGSPIKTSPSSGSDITKGTVSQSPSPDSSEFEKIPSRSDSNGSDVRSSKGEGGAGGGGDVGGIGKERSLEDLTEHLQQMEEKQHSTVEELAATLQELADQQQVVQELTAENERLAQAKGLLQTSLQQQRERVDLLSQKNESLHQRLREEAQTSRSELEQRYAELVESSRFEREKLVDIQQQLTGSLRALEKEHQEAQASARSLREERDLLQSRLERERQAGEEASRLAEERRAATEALRVEKERLAGQVETERQRVAEMQVVQSASDSTELRALLKAAHADRDRLELGLAELRQQLQQAHSETEHAQNTLTKVEAERQQRQEKEEEEEQQLRGNVSALEERAREAENQVKDLKETIFELEDQVEQQRAVGLHSNQTILDLENQIKKLEEQKFEQEKQLKALNKQMKDETEEWRRFQADLQTAVVVANDIKVEAQQEVRALRRRLQEEQEHGARLGTQLEQLQGARISTGAAFETKTAVEGR